MTFWGIPVSQPVEMPGKDAKGQPEKELGVDSNRLQNLVLCVTAQDPQMPLRYSGVSFQVVRPCTTQAC